VTGTPFCYNGEGDNDNGEESKFVRITIKQPDIKSTPNPILLNSMQQ